MQAFNTFYIHKSEFVSEKKQVLFHYSFDTSEYFTETITLSDIFPFREDVNPKNIENILFHSSIAFGISYYKLFPTKQIIIDSGNITQQQAKYWRNFYIQGLGEYFFTNDIDFRELCFFESTSNITYEKADFSLSEKSLLPIGGGKDSIVSSLLLEKSWTTDITPFIFWKMDNIKQDFLDIHGKSELLIKRSIDTKLFEMNQSGYYNGHVPITGLISFFMTFICYIYDYKYIVFSNEKSADIGNTLYHENEINHQYSKSTDFENDFSQYVSEYISDEISYSSLLREYYEIEIAKIFAEKWKKYFDVFSSCNKNFSITKKQSVRWCNTCSKCLFVYIILRPFLTDSETLQIFWEELYERKDLEPLFLEIIGISGMKPFECVGEVEEAQLAAYMSMEKFEALPYLLQVFEKHMHEIDFQKLTQRYIKN